MLAAIYARLGGDVSVLRASRENLLLPVDLVHAPTGTVIEVDDATHFTSFRLAALELYPARASTSRSRRRSAASGRLAPTASLAASPPRASGSAGSAASAPTATPCSTSPTPAMGHPPVIRIAAVDGDGAAAYAPPPRRASSNPYRRALDVGDRDVDRAAAPAADPHLQRHLGSRSSTPRARCRTRRRRSRRARWRGTPGGRDPPGSRCRRPAAPRPRAPAASPPRHQSLPSFPVKSLISASSTPATTPSPIDAALPVIWALVLTVPPPSSAARTPPSRWRGPGRPPRAT